MTDHDRTADFVHGAHKRPTDSAGQPWAGRHFSDNPFAGDNGEADPVLFDVLERFTRGEAEKAEVISRVGQVRLLVPLLAHAGETGLDDHGRTIDKTQELSLISVSGPDGRAVLPAFTSAAAMRAWNPDARPIPVAGTRVVVAAAGEGTPLVVLDPQNPSEFVLRYSAQRAIAEGTKWTPAHSRDDVLEAFCAVVGESSGGAIVHCELQDGDPRARLEGPEVRVVLSVRAGLARDELNAVIAGAQHRWASSPVIAEAVDSIALKLVST